MLSSRYPAWSRLVALSLLLVGLHCSAAEPIAIVTDAQGAAVQSGGARLAILAELGASAQLQLEAGARVTIAHFASGRQFDLEGPGVFRLTAAGIESGGAGRVTARAPLSAAYRDVRVRPSRVALASISMRGGADDVPLRLNSPVGTWLLEDRPAFQWQPIAGVGSYRFQLTDNTGRVLHQASTSEPLVRLPDTVLLAPGQTYAWQVEVTLPDGRVADGWTEFGVAGRDRRERVDAARPGTAASFGDRVLFALLLDDTGLREAARDAWEELARERPADPRLRALRDTR